MFNVQSKTNWKGRGRGEVGLRKGRGEKGREKGRREERGGKGNEGGKGRRNGREGGKGLSPQKKKSWNRHRLRGKLPLIVIVSP